MFSEKGVDSTTIEEITELADLGKGTFYRHFAGKDEVLTELIEGVVDELVTCLEQPKVPPATLADAIAHVLDTHAEFFRDNRAEFLLMFQGRLMLKLERDVAEDLEAPYMRYLQEIETQIAPFVAQPVDAGKIRRLAYVAAGFVSGFISFAMIGLESQDIDAGLQSLRHAFTAAAVAFLGQEGTQGTTAGQL